MLFSPEVRARAVRREPFDEVEQRYAEVAALRLARVDPRVVSPVAKLPVKVTALLQSGLRRVLELTEGVVREVNAGSFTPTFVLARASVETGCLLRDFSGHVERIAKAQNRDAIEDFDERIMQALLGGKSGEWKPDPRAPEALNVLTIIGHLDKRFPKLRSIYELLSEFAHPNYNGMIGAYQQLGGDPTIFDDHPAPARQADMALAVGGAGIGLLLTRGAIGEYADAEAAFVRLCEEHVYHRGEWPAGVPYPRPSGRGPA